MISYIFTALQFGLKLVGFFKWLEQQEALRRATEAGVQQQASKETVATIKTETAISQAEAQAPTTVQQVENSLDKGTF